MSSPGQLRARAERVVAAMAKLGRRGNADAQIRLMKALFDLATNRGQELPSELRFEVQARAAQLHLMMMRVHDAAKCLRPYAEVTDEGEVVLNESKVAELKAGSSSYGRGCLLRELGNLLYRVHRHKQGRSLAAIGNVFLKRDSPGPSGRDRLLAELESRIWWSRLLWHCEEFSEAKELIRECVLDLSEAMKDETAPRGGIDLLVAVALDLWASFNLAAGETDVARRRIYQALFLLRGGRVRCKVRLAYSMYSAARIEAAGYSKSSYQWCRDLFNESERLFGNHEHPFQLRARIMHAQFLTKHKVQRREVDELLNSEDLKSRLTIDPEEKSYVEASELLTRVWAEERGARENPKLWEHCIELGKQLDLLQSKPARLKAEGKLHLGLALIQIEKSRPAGQARLREALEISGRCNLMRIKAATHLAFVEYHQLEREPALAREHWNIAAGLLRTMRSSFLYDWSRRLEDKLEAPATVELNLEGKLKTILERVHQDYLKYHTTKTTDKQQLWQEMGVPQATGYRLLSKYLGKDGS